MNVVEMQILFQQIVKDVNPRFDVEDRPTSFEILNYFNKAIDRRLREGYLNYPTHDQRLLAIDENQDELRNLIVRSGSTIDAIPNFSNDWGSRGKRYAVSEDVMIPMSVDCKVSRADLYPMTDERMFGIFVTRKEAEKLVNNVNNKSIFLRPVVLWEDNHILSVIGDAYTSSITIEDFSYIRNPFTLSYNYAEIEGVADGNLTIGPTITDGSYFYSFSKGNYFNDAGGALVIYPGQKVKKQIGRPTIGLESGWTQKVGYPYGETDTPDFPEYLHESIIDQAIQMFLEEAKLKLVAKSEK